MEPTIKNSIFFNSPQSKIKESFEDVHLDKANEFQYLAIFQKIKNLQLGNILVVNLSESCRNLPNKINNRSACINQNLRNYDTLIFYATISFMANF